MRTLLALLCFFALSEQALAVPEITITDPSTGSHATVLNGHVQMDAPSGMTIVGTPAVTISGPVLLSGPMTVNGAMTDAVGSSGSVSLVQCDQTARVSGQSSSSVLIAHVTGKTTYICSYTFSVGLVISISAGLAWGTGTNCGSTQVPASPVLAVGLSILGGQLASLGGGLGTVDQSPTAGVSDYCIITTGSPATTGIVRYALI